MLDAPSAVQKSLEAFWLAYSSEDEDHSKKLSGKSCQKLLAAFQAE